MMMIDLCFEFQNKIFEPILRAKHYLDGKKRNNRYKPKAAQATLKQFAKHQRIKQHNSTAAQKVM
jgi:hypothetical protein